MEAIYKVIVFSFLVCFIILWRKTRSEPVLKVTRGLHFPFLIVTLLNFGLMEFNWRFIGNHTTYVLILLSVLTGIFTFVLLRNQNRKIRPPLYYKFFFYGTLILLLFGSVPVIVPYGGGPAYLLYKRTYATYDLRSPYYLRRIQYGVNHCFDIYLCKQYFILERDIPLFCWNDGHYDCVGDLMHVAIRESNDQQLRAKITSPYQLDSINLTLHLTRESIEAVSYVWYGVKTYKIDFSGWGYNRKYALETPYESYKER